MKPLIFNGISIYRKAFGEPKEFIEALEFTIKTAPESLSWTPATVINADRSITKSSVRTNEFLSLPAAGNLNANEDDPRKLLCAEVHKYFMNCVSDFCARYYIDAILDKPIAYQVLKYAETQHYDAHSDDGKNTRRRVSAVGYLNDDFDGGELHFPHLNFTYYPMAGDIVVFPSGAPFIHEAKPVKQGLKYSVVNWWE